MTGTPQRTSAPARTPVFERTVPDFGHLTLAPVDPATESDVIYAWTREERARFWMMGERTAEEVRDIYTWIDEQPTHAAYFLRLDGEIAALIQSYDPRAEEIGEKYAVLDGDLGVHAMLAPPTAPRSGFTVNVAAFVLDFFFSDPSVQRLIGEPDARNEKVHERLDALGIERGPEVELSVKPAVLRFVPRELYVSWVGR